MTNAPGQDSTSPLGSTRTIRAVLLALTALTGVIDAVSYLGNEHVFAANMTGNVVLLGFALAGEGQIAIGNPLIALAAFFCGAVLGGALARAWEYRGRRWFVTALALELLLIAAAAIATLATAPGAVIVVILALAMGIRSATVRRLDFPDLTTTVLTRTIAGLAADLRLEGAAVRLAAQRLVVVAAMLMGAAIGALLLHVGLAIPLIAGAIFLALVIVAYLVRSTREMTTMPAQSTT